MDNSVAACRVGAYGPFKPASDANYYIFTASSWCSYSNDDNDGYTLYSFGSDLSSAQSAMFELQPHSFGARLLTHPAARVIDWNRYGACIAYDPISPSRPTGNTCNGELASFGGITYLGMVRHADTPPAPWSRACSSDGPMMIIAAGAGALLLLIVVVLVYCFVRKKRAHRGAIAPASQPVVVQAVAATYNPKVPQGRVVTGQVPVLRQAKVDPFG